MKRIFLFVMLGLFSPLIFAGTVSKTYLFSDPRIETKGTFQIVNLGQCRQAGLTGEPMLPYHQVALMLPPGEVATNMKIIGSELHTLSGQFQLFPFQTVQPVSIGSDEILKRSKSVYSLDGNYPANPAGNLTNGFLNGFSFALSTFTPVIYNPAMGTVSYYGRVTVEIETIPAKEAKSKLKFLTANNNVSKRIRLFAENPGMINSYVGECLIQPAYEILIITPELFLTGYQDLVSWYNSNGRRVQSITTEVIDHSMTGQDLQEKIRNYIIQEYLTYGIDQVILGGDVEHVPSRGFHCYVASGSGYQDSNIPADIYYSALDGNWNANGNALWGEPGEEDLLPEISVGRMPFSTMEELGNMVHKSLSYQSKPVPGEQANPILVSEKLYNDPITWGADYLDLLVDNCNENGYFTYGIPSERNSISKLADSLTFSWSQSQLLDKINSGVSFIHHAGHAGTMYLMRLSSFDMTNQNFAKVNGVEHNYQLMYTHGCDCGAFNVSDCIAERSLTMANWLVAGVFNSRYGWFNQGTNDGPSPHLHREFVSALYHPDADSAIVEIGSAHTMSKIKTAPWVGLPGEFEPGAQRWVHYGCNVLGDPAIRIWLNNPATGMVQESILLSLELSPIPASDLIKVNLNVDSDTRCTLTISNSIGHIVHYQADVDCHTGKNILVMDTHKFAEGLYYCRMDTPRGYAVRKMIVVR